MTKIDIRACNHLVSQCRNSEKMVAAWRAAHGISTKADYYRLKRVCEAIPEDKPAGLQMDNADDAEPNEQTLTPEQIKKAVQKLTQRKEKYRGYLSELTESGETQLLTTDTEARRMHSKDGFHCCYNVQTAVDGGNHLIAEYEVTNHNTDQGLLEEVVEKAKETLDVEVIEAVADKGYESREDILNCVMNGIVPNVALKYDKNGHFRGTSGAGRSQLLRSERRRYGDLSDGEHTDQGKNAWLEFDLLEQGCLPPVPEPVHGHKHAQDSQLWAGREICACKDVWKRQP